ncbi:serine/threonine-protein phosphatase 7 inactive homolog [Eutrema salsugineum]|uniref:serine/threonine-protein phosphatase 7 inactive homolog n=1 Tax=Eutrema salsugineum TaxID=72664 RepID=UPI000CED0363|nr:serine/threonine-protein phosphatase 7 inactive homolog [Eutrema salsugineum]
MLVANENSLYIFVDEEDVPLMASEESPTPKDECPIKNLGCLCACTRILKDPENRVTRVLCSVLKQVVSNSDRSLKSLRGFHYETLDDQEKQQVTRMIASVQAGNC